MKQHLDHMIVGIFMGALASRVGPCPWIVIATIAIIAAVLIGGDIFSEHKEKL